MNDPIADWKTSAKCLQKPHHDIFPPGCLISVFLSNVLWLHKFLLSSP